MIFGLGDDGFGCIFIKDDFRMYENCVGREKFKQSVAKVDLIPTRAQDNFVWKVGGYTAITGGYTMRSKGKKKTPCFIQSMVEAKSGTGSFKTGNQLAKQVIILGEIKKDIFLMYSHTDHTFATWNYKTEEFKRINLVGKTRKRGAATDEISINDQGAMKQSVPAECILDKDTKYSSIMLHPGFFDDQYPYLIALTKDNKITVRRFELAEGYSNPVKLDEQKPGFKNFDVVWTNDGTLITYQVKRLNTMPMAAMSQQIFR